jgi:hypothetical protein
MLLAQNLPIIVPVRTGISNPFCKLQKNRQGSQSRLLPGPLTPGLTSRELVHRTLSPPPENCF